MKNYNKGAFTLAEVLITLGIIGVVASMTLPALVQNNRNKELQTGLKRSYSVLSQALDMYQAENGERITSKNSAKSEVKSVLQKYLKVAYDCGLGRDDKDTACIKNFKDSEKNSTDYKNFNGTNLLDLEYFDDGQLILNDGSLLLIENEMIASRPNIYISVDVNGLKKKTKQAGAGFVYVSDRFQRHLTSYGG